MSGYLSPNGSSFGNSEFDSRSFDSKYGKKKRKKLKNRKKIGNNSFSQYDTGSSLDLSIHLTPPEHFHSSRVSPLKRVKTDSYVYFFVRRFMFYCYFAVFLILVHFQVFNVYKLFLWFWIIHTLYLEIDVGSKYQKLFILFLNPLSFVGSFFIASIYIYSLIYTFPEQKVMKFEQDENVDLDNVLVGIWVYLSPCLMSLIDLIVGRQYLVQHFKLSFKKGNTRMDAVRIVLSILWIYLAVPLAISLFYSLIVIFKVTECLTDLTVGLCATVIVVMLISSSFLTVFLSYHSPRKENSRKEPGINSRLINSAP
eukprot:TRINITY_DN3338_c0_g1_i1.p1 TRINITY_DN3338_c0_g1~~TRINITY_DN3338_c0_g1_i1.p1  ORF type:complete len:329 (+),score=30.69 TRINITY_DN3338_c0_g1_i1:56-988(+)